MDPERAILLADDDLDFVLLLQTAFDALGISHPVRVVDDGAEVLRYLERQGKYRSTFEYPWPALLLLDIRLPRLDGLEVLHWIRRRPHLNDLRVAILTGTAIESEARRARASGADAFVVKPFQYSELLAEVEQLRDAWLTPVPA